MSIDENSEHESPKKISKKDFAKKIRREAYLRAKEFRKSDPRILALKALAKEQRKAAYQKAKERNKDFKEAKTPKIDLSDKICLASELSEGDRPLAKVIPINRQRLSK